MKKLVLMMTTMLCLGVMSCGTGSKTENENDTIKKDTCVIQSDTTVNETVDTISL